MAINVKIDPDIQHLIKGFEKGAKQFNSKSASKTKLKFAIDEKSFSRPLGKITGQVNMFESAMEAANARVIAFGASTAVLATVVKSLKDLVNVSIEVEAAFADINRILNLSGGNLDKFSNKLFDTAQKTASTFQAASSAALEFSRQGLKTEEVLKRTSDALTLVRLTGMNAKKSVDLLTATVNAFTDLDTTSAVDKFVAVETKFAVAARDLVEGLSRVGSAAVDAKVDFNELNALITAVQQTTGRGGAVIGNALKTIFTRLQRESTLEALERFNVTVRDVQGNILPATQVLDNFAGKYDKLADSTQAYLREQVAGVFQANILSAILKDLNKEQSTFSRALDVSVNATENAAQANEKLNQTMSALLQNTATEFAKLQKNLGDAAFLDLGKGIVGALQTALKSLNSALDKDSTGAGAFFAQGFISGLSNVLQGPVLIGALQIILKVAKQSFTFLAQAVPTLLNITTQAQKRAQTEEFINNLLRSDVDLTKQIFAAEGNQARQLELVLAKSRAITEQYQAQYRLSTSLGGAIVGGGSFITASGVKGSTASKIKNKAGGYTPSINAEQSAINRGVGGAGGGAYPVVIPNFAFGGGNVGPVVANSSEVMVPNYGGSGGSAIFNQQMISQYGMPNGAVPIAAYGYNTKLSQVAKGNLNKISKTNKNINANDRLKNGYDADFGLEGFPAFKDQSQYKSTKKYGEAYEDFVLNEFKTSLSGFPAIGSGKNWKSAHDFYRKDNSAIDLVKIVGNRITAMAEVKGGSLDKTQTLNKPSRFIGENLDDSRVGGMFRTPAGEDVKVKTLLITNLNKPVNTSGIVKSANGYIPNFAAGRGTLSSQANPLKLKAAQAENPFINPLDTGKIGYDRHEVFKLNVRNKKGSTKKGGGKINNEYGALAEKKALPFVKKLGYFPAKDVPGMHNKSSSAVDYIKTSNGSPTGGALTGVLELKAGDIKTNSMFKPLRSITENLHLPIVQNMFKKEGPENLKYESILATKPTARNPYKMTGMMRKGMGGANMARGYVPNFVGGRTIPGYMTGTGNKGKTVQNQVKGQVETLAQELVKGTITLTQFNSNIKGIAQSSGIGKGSMKAFEQQARNIVGATQKASVSMNSVASSTVGLQKSIVKQKNILERSPIARGVGKGVKGLMATGGFGAGMGISMLGGPIEQMISGGKSRIEQSDNQRAKSSLVSNVTTFAGAGAMFGPMGLAAGAVIGLAKGAMDASLSLEELKQKAEDYEKTTEENTSAAEQYIQSQRDVASANTLEELNDANKRAAEAMDKLKSSGSGLDSSFKDAGASISEMTKSLLNYEKQRGAEGLGEKLVASRDRDIEGLAGKFIREFVDPKVFSEENNEKAALKSQMRASNIKSAYTAQLFLNDLTQDFGVDADILESFKSSFKDATFDQKKLFLEEVFKQIANTKPEAASGISKKEQEIINFTAIKDNILLDVKKVQSAMDNRNMQNEFMKSLTKLQNSVLEGIDAPIAKFENMKSQLETDYLNRVENSADKFYTDNAAKHADIFGKMNKSQEGLKLLEDFQAALKSGGDISGFDEKARGFFSEDEIQNNPNAKAFFDQFPLLEQLNDRRLQQNKNEKILLDESLRIEEIKAKNTKEELNVQREISLMQSRRTLENAKFGVKRSAADRGLSARQFDLEMAIGLTGSERATRSIGISRDRAASNINLSNLGQNRDIDRINQDAAIELAKINRRREDFKESKGLKGIGDGYFNMLEPEAAKNFTKDIEAINKKAQNDREKTRIKAQEDRAGFTENLRKENERFLQEMRKRGPSGFGVGLDEGMDMVRDDLETFQYQLGKDIPMQFRDGMVSAMEATLDKTKDLKGALTDMAMDFMRIMRRQALENIVGSVMTIGGKQQGGFIKAQNGMYISGNRTGDRNPAMLEDGEYVLNRNAVRSLGGPSAIDRLNFGMAPRFKGGGAFLNMGVDSGRMSSKYFAGDDPLLGEMRDAAIAKEQRRQEKKAKKTALRNMIIQTAVSAAISSAASAMRPKTMAENAEIAEGDFYNNPENFNYQNGGYISTGPRNMDSVPAFMAGGEFVMNNKAVKKYGLGFMSRINGGYIPGYQSGGSVAESAEKLGSSNSSNTNNINISINMGSGSNESEGGSEGNDQSGTSDEKTKAKDLSEKVKTVVLQVINEEQRTGGSLSKTKVAR